MKGFAFASKLFGGRRMQRPILAAFALGSSILLATSTGYAADRKTKTVSASTYAFANWQLNTKIIECALKLETKCQDWGYNPNTCEFGIETLPGVIGSTLSVIYHQTDCSTPASCEWAVLCSQVCEVGCKEPPPCDYTSLTVCHGYCCGTCVNSRTNCYNCDSLGCDDSDDSTGQDGQLAPGETPILINLGHGPFRLTGIEDPVQFDIDADGELETLSWTEAGSTEIAFLVLDRNGNGTIDEGSELFGKHADQPVSSDPNGFEALAIFDQADFGGNDDGLISELDPFYDLLQLWFDLNHDGVSQAWELEDLAVHGVDAIEVDYVTSRRRDRYGNFLRWAGMVHFPTSKRLAASDVVFVIE